jgi:hypothetical protein
LYLCLLSLFLVDVAWKGYSLKISKLKVSKLAVLRLAS